MSTPSEPAAAASPSTWLRELFGSGAQQQPGARSSEVFHAHIRDLQQKGFLTSPQDAIVEEISHGPRLKPPSRGSPSPPKVGPTLRDCGLETEEISHAHLRDLGRAFERKLAVAAGQLRRELRESEDRAMTVLAAELDDLRAVVARFKDLLEQRHPEARPGPDPEPDPQPGAAEPQAAGGRVGGVDSEKERPRELTVVLEAEVRALTARLDGLECGRGFGRPPAVPDPEWLQRLEGILLETVGRLEGAIAQERRVWVQGLTGVEGRLDELRRHLEAGPSSRAPAGSGGLNDLEVKALRLLCEDKVAAAIRERLDQHDEVCRSWQGPQGRCLGSSGAETVATAAQMRQEVEAATNLERLSETLQEASAAVGANISELLELARRPAAGRDAW